jgi:hypothetical protein
MDLKACPNSKRSLLDTLKKLRDLPDLDISDEGLDIVANAVINLAIKEYLEGVK